MKKLASAIICLLTLTGCMTSEISRTPQGVPGDSDETHQLTVEIENVGWFLFDMIPVLSGDPQGVNKASSVLFENTLTLQNNLDELMRVAQREGTYTIGSMISHEVSESVWVIFLSRHALHTSATLMKKNQ